MKTLLKLIFKILVRLIYVFLILLVLEISVRYFLNYELTSLKLKQSSYIHLDVVKIWNKEFIAKRPKNFTNWPIPLETFESNKAYPRYYFKPNLKMKKNNCRNIYDVEFCEFVAAQPNEDIYWSSNNYGFRGKDFSLEKQTNKIRIITLGSSTTEGSQSDEETYPYYLEQNLIAKGYNVEVINAGRHGQSIDDHLEFFKDKIIPLDPDVLIFYEGNNDIYPGQWLDSWTGWSQWYKSYPDFIARLFEYSAAVNELTKILGLPWDKPKTDSHSLNLQSPKKSLINYENKLREIVQLSKEKGVKPVLISFVTIANEDLKIDKEKKEFLWRDVYLKWYPFTLEEIAYITSQYNNALKNITSSEKVYFFDLAQNFPKNHEYFWDHIHFTPKGNSILAGFVSDYLIGNFLEKDKQDKESKLIVN